MAATLLGHTQQIGYGPLVHSLCGVNLKKSDSFTDWSRRPLSTSQLEYAADDVIYLPKMYRIMVEKLEAKGRLHWLDNDFAAMSDPPITRATPSSATSGSSAWASLRAGSSRRLGRWRAGAR